MNFSQDVSISLRLNRLIEGDLNKNESYTIIKYYCSIIVAYKL